MKTNFMDQLNLKASHKKSLLIEDNPIVCVALSCMLENMGCDVDVAIKGVAALSLLKRKAYDLILTDIDLSDMSGIDVIKQIRRDDRHKKTKVIVQSASLDEALKEDCFLAGCNGVFEKQKPAELLEMLKMLVK